MSNETSISSNPNLPQCNDQPFVPLEPLRDGFTDTGVIIDLKIPFNIDTFRKLNPVPDANRKPCFDKPSICPTNRLPLFGFLVDPFFNHDLSGPYSPLIYPDPNWVTNNTQLTIRPYGVEHPLVRLSSTYLGWRGSLEFLITINSNALVQGELSIIRAKYCGNGSFKWKNLQLESEEPDNQQLINLASERRAVTIVSYSESSNFVNTMLYWQSINNKPIRNFKPMNLFRNWIFVRPNTAITTLSQNGGTLSFRVLMKPGADFAFTNPLVPCRPDLARRLSVVDKNFPFAAHNSVVVSQRPFTAPDYSRVLMVDDTATETTYEFTNTTLRTIVLTKTAWVNVRFYVPEAFPRWTPITEYRMNWLTLNEDFLISIKVEGDWVPLKEYKNAQLTYGAVLFDMYTNPNPYNSSEPPYFFP